MKPIVMQSLAALLSVITVGGCLSASPRAPAPPVHAADPTLADVIASIEPIPVDTQQSFDELLDSQSHDGINADGVPTTYSVETHRAGNSFDIIAACAPNADTLWSGALVQGKSLPSGTLAPFDLPRAAGRIVLRSAPIPGEPPWTSSRVVEDPNQGSVQDAIRDMVAGLAVQTTAASLSFTMKEFHSLEHAMLQAGMSASWLTGSMQAELSSSTYAERSNFVVTFVQSYYDVSFAPPTAGGISLFAPGTSPADAAPYIGPGNPPGYVSTVTYGRMLLVLVSSSRRADELRAALSAALAGGMLDGHLSVEQQAVIEESEIRVLAVGGGAPAAITTLGATKLDALAHYLQAGANFSTDSPGSPISYQVRYLRDNTPARLSYTTEYRIQTNTPKVDYLKPMTATILGLYFHDVADNDEDMAFAVTVELIGVDDKVVAQRSWNRNCVYVEEYGKIGGWHEGRNRFFTGEAVSTDQPVVAVRASVAVATCDGDGLPWQGAMYRWPTRKGEQVLSGGGAGEYRLHLRFD